MERKHFKKIQLDIELERDTGLFGQAIMHTQAI